MKLTPLTAVSPIDGRYNHFTCILRSIFSEFGFLRYRLNVEVQWFKKIISMSEILKINNINYKEVFLLDNIINEFDEKDAVYVKSIEKKIGQEKSNSIYLFKLFPEGPAKQASKIAGVPKPSRCL